MTMTEKMTAFLATLKEIFTWIIGCLGDFITFVLAQPVLLLPIGIGMFTSVVIIFFKVRHA
jgi:hypothetical protein